MNTSKGKKLLATNSQPLEKQWLTEKKTILVQKIFINYLQINSVISKENYEQESCSLFHKKCLKYAIYSTIDINKEKGS